ncbi:anaerobic ribonucleoside-triphosphate reductase activating protein [Desulfoluna sp.]|uniref:anaerobic ribonucleoside-triphosphate reductase activating protein n=1 Tax=Desulfoluna sp. TaxID=2045199 RepID=UPI0026372A28|nr:anaerobic ribonucleoside-triphosphate reductase activating protein [Desulfoluna sp.]
MIIGGLNKCSLIDYPGKIGAVVFTYGCNLTCPYCHNAGLVSAGGPETPYEVDAVLDFLKRRVGRLDAVVVSGGEPCLHNDLPEFIGTLKAMGYLVKLDTNGSRPAMLKSLMEQNLVDYVAMDIKTDPASYEPYLSSRSIEVELRESVSAILHSGLPHEFRTTCTSPFIDEAVLDTITCMIEGAELYALQEFNPKHTLNPEFFNDHEGISPALLKRFKLVAEGKVGRCVLRMT